MPERIPCSPSNASRIFDLQSLTPERRATRSVEPWLKKKISQRPLFLCALPLSASATDSKFLDGVAFGLTFPCSCVPMSVLSSNSSSIIPSDSRSYPRSRRGVLVHNRCYGKSGGYFERLSHFFQIAFYSLGPTSVRSVGSHRVCP